MFFYPAETSEQRVGQLINRLEIARHTAGQGETVIGVGLERIERDIVGPWEFVYLDATEWSPEDDESVRNLKDKLSFDSRLTQRSMTETEYPDGS